MVEIESREELGVAIFIKGDLVVSEIFTMVSENNDQESVHPEPTFAITELSLQL